MSVAEWTRIAPDEEGWWLRINVAKSPQPIHVFRHWNSKISKRRAFLAVVWGFNGNNQIIPVSHPKLQGWLWMKIPEWTGPPLVKEAMAKK